MKQNLGITDKYLRLVLGVVLVGMAFGGFLSGTMAIVGVAAAAVLMLTAWANFCPLYALLGINTCSVSKKS